jgi:hypothetical protein
LKWSIENKVEVNYSKSAILETRVDNRTPRSLFSPIAEIPLLREYQYLGVTFSDSLNMKLNHKKKQERKDKLKQFSWILNSQQLDGATAFHIFMALFRSKINYAMNIITIFDRNSRQWYESYLYASIKELLGIKENVSKSLLIEVCLGKSFEEYIQQEQQNTISKMINYPIQNQDIARAKNIENFCDFNKLPMPDQVGATFQHVHQELPLKAYLKAELRH